MIFYVLSFGTTIKLRCVTHFNDLFITQLFSPHRNIVHSSYT